MRKCVRCLKVKQIIDFWADYRRPDNLKAHCKDCDTTKVRKKERIKSEKSNNKNISSKLSFDKTTKNKQIDLKRHYGITLEYYDFLFTQQIGCCAICGVSQGELKSPLCVDHDHITKEVRGLLCHNCNRGIGYLKEDCNTIFNSIIYLQKYINYKLINTKDAEEKAKKAETACN